MNVWLTSDCHFSHRNILKLGKGRPFDNIEEHDQALMDNWNSVVAPGDVVYVLGDMFFTLDMGYMEYVLGQLNGSKHLILGNHDRTKIQAYLLNKNLWQSIRDNNSINCTLANGKTIRVIMSHYPILEFNGAYRQCYMHAYGHIHDITNYDYIYRELGFKAVNVGVDVSGNIVNTDPFTPVNIENAWLQANLIAKGNTDEA